MSVGVIGGADGPTSIFVAGSSLLLSLTAAAVILIIAAVVWHNKNK